MWAWSARVYTFKTQTKYRRQWNEIDDKIKEINPFYLSAEFVENYDFYAQIIDNDDDIDSSSLLKLFDWKSVLRCDFLVELQLLNNRCGLQYSFEFLFIASRSVAPKIRDNYIRRFMAWRW